MVSLQADLCHLREENDLPTHRDAWFHQSRRHLFSLESEVQPFKVGERTFSIHDSHLRQANFEEKFKSPGQKSVGPYFFDMDGHIFEHLLSFLRHGIYYMPAFPKKCLSENCLFGTGMPQHWPHCGLVENAAPHVLEQKTSIKRGATPIS